MGSVGNMKVQELAWALAAAPSPTRRSSRCEEYGRGKEVWEAWGTWKCKIRHCVPLQRPDPGGVVRVGGRRECGMHAS